MPEQQKLETTAEWQLPDDWNGEPRFVDLYFPTTEMRSVFGNLPDRVKVTIELPEEES
jgi:hypothetical protein